MTAYRAEPGRKAVHELGTGLVTLAGGDIVSGPQQVPEAYG